MKQRLDKRIHNEIVHFSDLPEVWWGAKSKAGQKRYDNKVVVFYKLCKPTKDAKILEIGSGYGEFTKRIAKLRSSIIATDVTPKVISESRKRYRFNNVSFKVEDCNKLKFRNSSFDIVCGISILHHVDTGRTLTEAFRVLKKGGRIFFTEPNLLNPHIILGLNVPFMRDKMEYSPDETALIRWRVSKLLKKIGYKNIRVMNYDFLHPKTPENLIGIVERLSGILEKTPLLKELSGSLIVYAEK